MKKVHQVGRSEAEPLGGALEDLGHRSLTSLRSNAHGGRRDPGDVAAADFMQLRSIAAKKQANALRRHGRSAGKRLETTAVAAPTKGSVGHDGLVAGAPR